MLNQSLLTSRKNENDNQIVPSNLQQSRYNSSRNVYLQNSKLAQQEDTTRYQNGKNHLDQSSIIQTSSSSKTEYYLYNFWRGNQTFILQGLLSLGPRIHIFWNLMFWIFILMMGGIHLGFVIPYVLDNISLGLGVVYIVLFILLIIFTVLTQFSDPGYIPRRKMIKAIPKIQQRIDNLEEMLNDKAFKTISEMQNNDQNCQKLGQYDCNQLKQSGYSYGINNSKIDNSSVMYGNQFMNARTNVQSDLFLFKKTGSIIHSNQQKNTKPVEKQDNENVHVELKQSMFDNNRIKKMDTSIKVSNGLPRSPHSVKVNSFENQVHFDIEKINENKVQDQIQNGGQYKNSLPQSQISETFDQNLSRIRNPFVSERQNEEQMSKRVSNYQEEQGEGDDSQRNTTELFTQGFGDVEERDENEEEDDCNEANQNKDNNNNQNNNEGNHRQKFHMHIQIQSEKTEGNDEENEEMKKRRTIFSYLDQKRSRQQTSLAQLSLAKEDTQQGYVMIDYESENQMDLCNENNQRRDNQNIFADQQKKQIDANNYSVLRDQYENTSNIMQNSIKKVISNNSTNSFQIEQKILNKQSINSLSQSNQNNFLCVKKGVMLQDSIISPKIDVDNILEQNQHQEEQQQQQIYCNENICTNKVSSCHHINQHKNENMMNKEKNPKLQNINNQIFSNSGDNQVQKGRGRGEQIDDQKQKDVMTQIIKDNSIQQQEILTNNQISSFQNIQRENYNPIVNEKENNLDEKTNTYFKEKNEIQSVSQYAFNQMNKANNFTEALENQKQYKRTDSDEDKSPKCESTTQGDVKTSRNLNVFTFKAQKCHEIMTKQMTDLSSGQYSPQTKQQIDCMSDQEEKKQQQTVEITQNRINTNLFFKSKPGTLSQLPQQIFEQQKKQELATNTVQNEDDHTAHKQFMMLSVQSNQITPKNNQTVSINSNTFSKAQAVKLNERFTFEMNRHEQQIKRLSDSLMQNAQNVTMNQQQESAQQQEKIHNRNIFDLPPKTELKDSQVHFYNGRKFCVTCKIFRPPRSSHCTYCDCCVEVLDHHCKFINNCVGKHNYKYFFTFLSLLKFTFLIQFISQICFVVKMKVKNANTYTSGEFAMGIIYLIVILLSWLYVLYLWGFHIYIQFRQLTTREYLRDLDCDKDSNNYFNWCSRQVPIFLPRIQVTDNQRYDLLENY